MGQWQIQIREHAVWQLLKDLGPAIDQAASREGTDAATLDLIERLRSIMAFVGKRLAGTDPALLAPQPLDALASQLPSVMSELQGYISDGQSSHLVTANLNGSECLIQLARLPGSAAPDELTALSEAAAGYRSSMEQVVEQSRRTLKELELEASGLSEKLNSLGTELSNQRSTMTSLTSDFQGQFSSAQESRAREFTDQQGIRQKEFGEGQTARQTRFDELHASFSQRLNDQDAEFTKQRETTLKDAQERLATLDVDYQASAKTILESIQKHLFDVEKLVGVIGNLAVTSGYQRAAESAKKAMWFWQGLTLVGFTIVIVFAFRAFLPAIQGEFSWERFAGRVALTIAVGVFAAYAAAQADRYMEAERRNRKLALELEAIGPYLAPLPEDKQQEFRLALGDRTFGREEHGFNRRERSPATPIDVVIKNKGLRDFVVELIKAVRNG